MGLGPSRIARMPDITGGGHRDIISTALPDAVRRLGENAGKAASNLAAAEEIADAPTEVPILGLGEYETGTLTGTADTVEMDFDLPSVGVWHLVGEVRLEGSVYLEAGDEARVNVGVYYSGGNATEAYCTLARADSGDPRSVGVYDTIPINAYHGDGIDGGVSDDLALTVRVTTDGVSLGGDFIVNARLHLTARRLGDVIA